MLVKIVNGIYGHRPKLANGKPSEYVVPVSRYDPPINVDEAEAERLVAAGVAEYAEKAPETAPEAPEDTGAENVPAPEENAPEAPETAENAIEYSANMKADELRAAMREKGLPIHSGMTKAQMADALNGAMPVIEAQDVVDE